jgi:YVTN family beta-propeller protein
VSARRPGLPRALDDVVARALDKDPERRWASGAELIGAASAALGGIAPKTVRVRPGRSARPRRTRPRRAGLAGLAAGLLVAVGAGAVLLSSDDGPGVVSVRADSMAIVDPGDYSLLGQVKLRGSPAAIADGAGAVWVTDEDRGVVSRIEKETRTVSQTIRVGRGPASLAIDREGVWVANRQDGTLSVISPQTNEVVDTIPVGRTVEGLCIMDGTVWVASPLDYTVVRIDPRTGKRQGAIRLESQPVGLACGAGTVWASSPSTGAVTEITSSAKAPTRTIQVSRGISAMALGKGGLWVANPPDGTVSRIDPERGAVTATIPVGERDGPAHLVVTDEAMWVSSELGGTIARVDHGDARVVEKLPVGNRPQGLAEVDGALWIAVADDGTRHRGGTLEVEYGLGAASVGELAFELQAVTNDGLVGFPRQPTAAPVVANLAQALPIPSDGGRTYAFRLRKGIRYSDGKPVLASHVVPGIQRAMQVFGPVFRNIRGANRCTPKRCDLSKGVVADDRAGTVVIHLTTPDPDLLFKLANPTAALVPPAALKAGPLEPPPATGPYRITRFEPDRLVRLERNARFRSWSSVARPDGYPEVITARLGVTREGVIDRLLSGKIDLAGSIDLPFPPDALARLRRRAPGQARTSVAPVTQFFFLNTKRPPFDDVDARRAVSFAFDRRAAVKAFGGADAAQETCQVLPPNFPGHRPYCPYTVPGSGGARGRPNLAEARRLVRRSGTRGMRVTVHVPSLLNPALRQVMVRTLRTLGYRADIRALPPQEHFPAVTAPDSRAQVAYFPWLADYPAPSTFFGLFACGAAPNPARFCDRELDRMVAEASRLQLTDPGAADARWARVERRVVDKAPAVAMYNLLNVDVLSSRVGNYRNVPLLGTLLDQAWVR